MKSFTRRSLFYHPIFWVGLVSLSLISSWIAFHFYPKAFPSVNLSISIDRISALKQAQSLAERHQWGPSKFHQTASFYLDQSARNYVELTQNGVQKIRELLDQKIYSFYTWKVRHFFEGDPREVYFWFTPGGDFYGFYEKLSENEKGAQLNLEQAQACILVHAKKWNISLQDYRLVETSQQAQPSGRIDHYFTYEKKDFQVDEAYLRLQFTLSGDRFTSFRYFIKIPDSFNRKYNEMRSFNQTLAHFASLAIAILYGIVGCGIGLFFLLRKKRIVWKPALIFAGVITLFQFLENLNQFPLEWMAYDTALSTHGFIFKRCIYSLVHCGLDFIFLALSFVTAEGLTRSAFGQHSQFWKIHQPQFACTWEILGRVGGAFLLVPIFFALVTFTYMIGRNYLGWWIPSDILFHPDGLASYAPFWTSIAHSLHAGFWEEALFRAIPLAGAALIGEKWGRKKLWLSIGMLIQVLIFGAAHANYSAQPFYARLVELILPSFLFGMLYLRFGLLLGCLLHFLFDVVAFAVPVFFAKNLQARWNQVLIVALALTPLWILLFYRLRGRHWRSLPDEAKNQYWTSPLPFVQKVENVSPVFNVRKLPAFSIGVLGVLALIGAWGFYHIPFWKNTKPLNITRNQAISKAQAFLKDVQVQLSPSWEILACPHFNDHFCGKFIWKTHGKEKFQDLLGTYLDTPAWVVRFVRFDAPVDERAEEYLVFVNENGKILRWAHVFPEGRKIKNLTKAQALQLASETIQARFGLKSTDLKLLSAYTLRLPERQDWSFIYQDPSVALNTGEARITVRIAGSEVSQAEQFIFVPEEWQRQERNKGNLMQIVKFMSSTFLALFFFGGALFGMIRWGKGKFNVKAFWLSFIIFGTFKLFHLMNGIPSYVGDFNTVMPKFNQWINLIGSLIFKIIFCSLGVASIVGYLHQKTISLQRISLNTYTVIGLIGILMGSVLSGGFAFLLEKELPQFYELGILSLYCPFGYSFNLLSQYISQTVIFLLLAHFLNRISNYWSKKIALNFFLIFIFCFAFYGESMKDFLHIFGMSGLTTLLIFFSFWLIRAHLFFIPLLHLCVFLFSLFPIFKNQTLFPTLGGLTIVLLGVVGISWHFWMKKQQTIS